jgi:AraC family transcriptional regulator, regulatory protein of adaptative response / methylated-DNA-[protein]-cysteine methyltransferase
MGKMLSTKQNFRGTMTTQNFNQLSEDYTRIEQAIHFLEENAWRQPSLQEVAASVHLSEFHFQRLFTRWAGISPKRFMQFLTKENAKKLLVDSNTLDAAYSAGLSSPGRLHDLFVNCEAVTPGEYKQKGEGLKIIYGYHPTPYGECLIASTERGICSLAFVTELGREAILQEMKADWSNALWVEDSEKTGGLVKRIFSPDLKTPISLHLRGTNFQIKVWEALLRVPQGQVTCYENLAEKTGNASAPRAVGNALAHNPVAYLIPCHRVLRKVGEFGNYRYGSARKKAMLLREIA